MTSFLQDILRQPEELQGTLDFVCTPASHALQRAAAVMQRARHICLTGMGSSWHAALNAGSILHLNGSPVCTLDACVIGQDLPVEAAASTFQLPKLPRHWQFVLDLSILFLHR